MPDARRIFGNKSEDLAAKYLKNLGIKILERQFKTKIGEVDLIGKDGNEIVFVEVKARKSNEFGYPEESVTPKKLEKIARVAEQYLRLKKIEDQPFRIDVVAIEQIDKQNIITYYKAV
ncbi:YraN family protein [Candidatus Uhrbacteria bacterium CG10_big_fil_rev_8_21_14_0_10_41_26]|nr:MAG: YraN family protein [Candidatus Uhrbacteria bacterium CG_4_10_14_3_um_filter_41_21]PIZ54295.1 MAG: YraN family protein [Candidatus Uhrbacteria bacterium CG_4_10_14_0_2_um_filter_41_21]PJB85050.1 MAG: YraN family protein [Candidatus Uhrbacteria bacterium CG_4_9_14_0_8_um_filter_41_16]PJE75365.1 MAG: YraN family protein [Candidatus Uhrbacteria bacterium CG10_big_fil_rev_8_21_14_0_10_41_26]